MEARDAIAGALGELGLDQLTRDLEGLLAKRSLRVGRFEDLVYVSFRRPLRGVPEGTLVVFARGGASRIIWGYPPIRRILLPRVAVERWFPGPTVIVEEKMNGYNVRVFKASSKIYAATRGGLVCPYTTRRLRRLYGERLHQLLDSLGDDYFVAGEVVGMENPYTRYYYPEAPEFGYFIFDVFRGRTPLPPRDKYRLAGDVGLETVRLLAEIRVSEEGVEELLRVVDELERDGREGVVLKDPDARVEPLKYTTSHTNIGDLRLGMRFLFEEGRSFLFSRILREAFKEWSEEKGRYEELGRAILEPAIGAIDAVARGEGLYEEFTLTLGGGDEVEEVLAYFASLGVALEVSGVAVMEGGLKASFRKPRKSQAEIARVLESGLSPLD